MLDLDRHNPCLLVEQSLAEGTLTLSPRAPGGPFSPGAPGSPLIPAGPGPPGAPELPGGPGGPSLPAGPALPGGPGLPCKEGSEGKRELHTCTGTGLVEASQTCVIA